MKNVKMWANTNEEAKSIINCALAHGFSYGRVTEDNYDNGGFYFNADKFLTHSERENRQYFDDHEFQEFFFAAPVYLSEKDSSISDTPVETPKHSHYYKDVSALSTIDVYRVLSLWNVTDPCIQHALKKLLVAGGRGAGKDIAQDIDEAIDSLNRWKSMREEESV